MTDKNRNFNWRSFVSIFICITFVVISLSGIILYLAPSGRIAHWYGWTILGFSKNGWQAIHTIFSFIFVVMAVVHIYYNWKPLKAYVTTKLNSKIKMRPELALALVISVAIFLLTAINVPPFSTFVNWGDQLAERWTILENEPPVPHAEVLTLERFAELIDTDVSGLVEKLKEDGITVNNRSVTLAQLAEENSTTPNNIYDAVIKHDIEPKQQVKSKRRMGRLTIMSLCDELGIAPSEGIKILSSNHINARPNDRLNYVSKRYGKKPADIVNMLRGVN